VLRPRNLPEAVRSKQVVQGLHGLEKPLGFLNAIQFGHFVTGEAVFESARRTAVVAKMREERIKTTKCTVQAASL
jgi:hypothetical protein